MEIKIGRYLLPLVIGTISAFFLIILFSVKDVTNNVNENILEKKYTQMSSETQKDVEILYKSLKVIQPNVNISIKHTHKHIERTFLNIKYKASNEKNKANFLFSENQTFSYIIYSNKSKNAKEPRFNCEAWSSNNNIHFDKMNRNVLSIVNSQPQIIKRLSQKEIINKLENIGNKIYIVSYYGITDANGRLINIVTLFIPTNDFIKFTDFVYNNEFNNTISILNASNFNEVFQSKDNGILHFDKLLLENPKRNGRVYSKLSKTNDTLTSCNAWIYYEPFDVFITSNSNINVKRTEQFSIFLSSWKTNILVTLIIIIVLFTTFLMIKTINKEVNEYFDIFKALISYNYDRCKKLIHNSLVGEKKALFWNNHKKENENLEKIQLFISKKNNIDTNLKQNNEIAEKNNNFRKIINETYLKINHLIDIIGEIEQQNLISHINKLENSITLISRNISVLTDKLAKIKKNINQLNNLGVTTNILSINFSILKQQIADKNINEYTNFINSLNSQMHLVIKQFNDEVNDIDKQITALESKFNNVLVVVDTMKAIEQKSDSLFNKTKNKIENLKHPLLSN